jgi:hypothetical protein
MQRRLAACGQRGGAVGRSLRYFLKNPLDKDLRIASLTFRKGFLRHETIAALVDGHIVVTGLTRDRVVTD